MSKQILLVDFDRTLFDTDKFTLACWQAIAQLYGIDAQAALTKAGQFYVINGDMQYYDFKAHITAVLDKSTQDVTEAIRPILKTQNFVYNDAASVLEWSSKRQVAILTYGQEWHQRYKISFAPQFKDIPVIIVLQQKGTYIAEHFKGKRGWLVDDKQNRHMPDGFGQIHLVRDRIDLTTNAMPTINTLAAVSGIVGF